MKPEFAIATEELRPGVTLFEASAGTGKTYTIAGLFLRFVVEQGIDVRQILVTTRSRIKMREVLGQILSLEPHERALNDFIVGGEDAKRIATLALAVGVQSGKALRPGAKPMISFPDVRPDMRQLLLERHDPSNPLLLQILDQNLNRTLVPDAA